MINIELLLVMDDILNRNIAIGIVILDKQYTFYKLNRQ